MDAVIEFNCSIKIILYSSRARGDHTERSDIDIAVDFDNAQESDWLKVIDAIEKVNTLLKIDCVRYDSLSDEHPYWKLLKKILFSLGEDVAYSRDILKEAYKGKLIDNSELWLQMLQDRNQTSHTYDEDLADKIYNNIKMYFPVLKRNFEELNKKFKDIS